MVTYTLEELRKMMNENGGDLDLSGTAITALPENLTVGDSLDLRGTAITALPENLTVGGWLDLSGTAITEEEANKIRRPKDGEYIPGRYLYADGILTHIKTARKIDGYTLYAGKIPGRNVVYDGTYYAHCESLRDGISDLLFKHCEDRGAEQFNGIDPDEKHSVDELVTMYRIITGACRQGSDEFVKSLAQRKELKDMYTIREAAELTEGQYNAERFREFFGF